MSLQVIYTYSGQEFESLQEILKSHPDLKLNYSHSLEPFKQFVSGLMCDKCNANITYQVYLTERFYYDIKCEYCKNKE